MGILYARVGGAWEPVLAGTGDATYLKMSGGTMTGILNMGTKRITNLGAATADTDAVTRAYVNGEVTTLHGYVDARDTSVTNAANDYTDAVATEKVNKTGDTMSAALTTTRIITTSTSLESEFSSSLLVGKNAVNIVTEGNEVRPGGTIFSTTTLATANLSCLRHGVDANSVGQQFIRFAHTTSNTYCGAITLQTGSTVAYSGTSDYRRKNDLGPISDGLARLMQLRPIRFTWKSEPEAGKFDGFLAHEVDEVVAGAVTGEKDAVDKEGEVQPQGLDPAKLVPLLTAAVQELAATVAGLSTRVAALE